MRKNRIGGNQNSIKYKIDPHITEDCYNKYYNQSNSTKIVLLNKKKDW